MPLKTIKINSNTRHRRTHNFSVRAESGDTNTISIAISSETPYRRYIYELGGEYDEILGHESDNIDMRYMVEGAPFLVDHWTDSASQIGVLTNVRVDPDKVMRADVKFSKSDKAQELLDDIKSGIRSRVSVGYSVEEYTVDEDAKTVRANRWTPYESSLVTLPADLTVGVGKSARKKRDDLDEIQEQVDALENALATLKDELADVSDESDEETKADETPAEDATDEDEAETEAKADDDTSEEEDESTVEDTPSDSTEEDEDEDDATEANQKTNSQIRITRESTNSKTQHGINTMKQISTEHAQRLFEMATEYGMNDRLNTWLSEGRSLEAVKAEILDAKRNSDKVSAPTLSTKESKNLSLVGAVEALIEGENSLLREIGSADAKKRGIETRAKSLYIPVNMPLIRNTRAYQTNNNASALVANEYLSFIDALYVDSIIGKLGVEIKEGVRNVLKAPRGNGVQGAWVTEGSSIGLTSGSFTNITWEPKTYAVAVPYTRQINVLDGTYSTEDIVRNDIFRRFTEVSEQAVLAGTGSAQPSGICGDANVTLVSPALASASVLTSYSDMLSTQQSQNGRDGVFVLTPYVYNKAQASPQFPGASGPGIIVNSRLLDKPVFSTNHLPTTFAGGQAALYGNFDTTLSAIFALELFIDEYTAADTGGIVLRGFLHMDSHIRQPGDVVKRGLLV